MTIDDVNLLERSQFVKELGWIFEDSPWVAERAWVGRPFRDVDDLFASMTQQIEWASAEEKVLLLCAHPDLGTRARISPASVGEQNSAGLNRLTPEEFELLHRLNNRYRDKFGFPFLLAVKGSTKHEILRALERRLQSTPEQEYREALRQVERIARLRLEDTITASEPLSKERTA